MMATKSNPRWSGEVTKQPRARPRKGCLQGKKSGRDLRVAEAFGRNQRQAQKQSVSVRYVDADFLYQQSR
jgi:hypothetical protein